MRDYGLEPQVWDDNTVCGVNNSYEWGEDQRPANYNYEDKIGAMGNLDKGHQKAVAKTSSQFCRHCNAWKGSLGLEPTPELYISHIVQVFQAVRRVLRKDGVCWVNLGDSYAGYWGDKYAHKPFGEDRTPDESTVMNKKSPNFKGCGLKPKDLCGIPWRVFFALQADGWWGRAGLPWVKRSSMPESVNGWRWEQHRLKAKAGNTKTAHSDKEAGKASWTVYSGQGTRRKDLENPEYVDCPGCPKCTPNDGYVLLKGSGRPTSALEYVFQLTKSESYFFDMEAVRVEAAYDGRHDTVMKGSQKCEADIYPGAKPNTLASQGHERWPHTTGDGKKSRNFRNTDLFYESIEPPHGMIFSGDEPVGLDVNPQAFKQAHFATFGEKLVMPLIKAGTSEKGCCPECGSPYVRIKSIDKCGAPCYSDKYENKTMQGVSEKEVIEEFSPSHPQDVQSMCSDKEDSRLVGKQKTKLSESKDPSTNQQEKNCKKETSLSENNERPNDDVGRGETISPDGERQTKCQGEREAVCKDRKGQTPSSDSMQQEESLVDRSEGELHGTRLDRHSKETKEQMSILQQRIQPETVTHHRSCDSINEDGDSREEQHSGSVSPMQLKEIELSWRPSCECHNLKCKITGNICGTDTWEVNHPCKCENCQKDLKPIPCTVLDPFAGSCRALIVAKKLGRRGIGIDLKSEYLEMPKKELSQERLF